MTDEHRSPEERTSERGAADSRLSALRRAAFSRDATPEQLAELRAAEALAEEQRATAPPVVDAVTVQAAEAPQPAPAPVRATASHRPWRLIVAGALVAVVIAAIGFSIGRSARPPDIRVTSSAIAGAEAQRGTATLALLETAQKPTDIPPFSLGYDIISSTIHRLVNDKSPAVTVFGAISHEGLICLITVDADKHSAESCVTKHVFVTEGIRLRVTTGDTVTDDAGFAQRAFYQYYWSSDGQIAFSTNQYLYPASPHL